MCLVNPAVNTWCEGTDFLLWIWYLICFATVKVSQPNAAITRRDRHVSGNSLSSDFVRRRGLSRPYLQGDTTAR
jgi:hypothetical protein